jgi:hypothetical protein
VSKSSIWKEGKQVRTIDPAARVYLISPFAGMTPVICSHANGKLKFEALSGAIISEISANAAFETPDGICSMANGNLYRHTVRTINNKEIVSTQVLAMVSELSSKKMPNLVYQDLLGKSWLTIPISNGVLNVYVKELDGRKVLNARYDKGICIVMTEKNGHYDKFVLIFKKGTTSYDIRKIADVNYENLNFVVLDNGVCIHVKEDDVIELFRDNATIKEVVGTPLASDMPLFSSSNQVYFINEKSFTQATMK